MTRRIYEVNVYETRTYLVKYTVSGKDDEEALEKAGIGDTLEEKELKLEGVESREPDLDTLQQTDEVYDDDD